MKCPAIRIIIIGLCLGVALPHAATAGSRIILSPLKVQDDAAPRKGLRISPTLYVGARTDDNFYKDQDDEQRVNTVHIDPGIRIHYEGDRASGTVWYEMKGRLYDGADKDTFVGHLLDVNGKYQLSPRLLLTGGNKAARYRGSNDDGFTDETADMYENDEDVYSSSQAKYYSNSFFAKADYEIFRNIHANIKYNNEINGQDGDGISSTDNIIKSRLEYWPSRLGLAAIEYRRNWRDEEAEDGDFDADRLLIGAGTRAMHFEVFGAIGHHWRYFDGPGRKDAGDIIYDFRLGAFTEGRKTIGSFRVRRDYSRGGTLSGFEKNTKVSSTFSHHFLRRFRLGADVSYEVVDYQEPRYQSGKEEWRKDHLFDFSMELAYRFEERLQLSLKGGLEKNDSNMNEHDHGNRYVMLGVDTYFDWMK